MRNNHLPASVVRRPRAVLLFALALTLILGSGIPRLKMRPFFEGDLPSHEPILVENRKYSSVFGSDETAYLALVSDTLYRPGTLAKIVAITEELNALEDVRKEETLSLATVRRVKWSDGKLDIRRYLSSLPQSAAEIERLRRDIRLDDDVYGRLVSSDETATLFAVKLEPGYDHRGLYDALHAIARRYSGPEQIYPFGHQIMNEEANMGMRHDMALLGPAALALMAVGIFFFFRSVRLTLGPLLIIILSVIWTCGLIYYMGFPLSILSSSMPAVLIALGSSYAIHVIYSCTEQAPELAPGERVVEGVSQMRWPISLAAATSMTGFLTLVVFKILSIREFGIYVAVGVGLAALLSLVALPSLMLVQKGALPRSRRHGNDLLDRMLAAFARWVLRRKYLVFLLAALILAVAAVGILKIKVGVIPEEVFPPDHRARKVIALFTEHFQGPYHLNVMFTAARPEELKSPRTLEQIDSFQRFAETLPHVKHTHSIVDILKKMNRMLNEDDPRHEVVPENEEMVAQLLLLQSLSQEPVQFASLIDYDHQRCKVSVATTTIDSIQIEEIYRRLDEYARHNLRGLRADFGGRSMVWIAKNHYIIRGKIINIIVNTVLIWGICALAFRSVRLGLISIVPLSIATMLTFGLMGHLGIRLDMATAVLTGISVGVGVDFAIHFITRLKRQSLRTRRIDEAVHASMLGSGRAIMFDATSNVLGFSVCMLSGFTALQRLGLLICFMMVSCVALTLILLPAIFAIFPIPFRHKEGETVFLQEWEEEQRPAPAVAE